MATCVGQVTAVAWACAVVSGRLVSLRPPAPRCTVRACLSQKRPEGPPYGRRREASLSVDMFLHPLSTRPLFADATNKLRPDGARHTA